jgi:3-deoxy-7-phosphoheptulonate synthase
MVAKRLNEEVRAVILLLRADVKDEELAEVVRRLEEEGLTAYVSRGVERTIVGVIGHDTEKAFALAHLPQVEQVVPVKHPYKLASRDFHPDDTVVTVGGHTTIGTDRVTLMAGPCAVESEEQLMTTAEAVAKSGARILRGGAYKPRTSPYSFQGLGPDGLYLLDQARSKYGLAIVTEAMDEDGLGAVAEVADMIQIGARNMHNFAFLRKAGQLRKPVLLKRGLSATIEEWLLAAEYILAGGNTQVVLCERGIRTFEPMTRNTLDLSAIPVVQYLSHLPVIVDPSHATGTWQLVPPMARAGVASGADGIIVEIHPDPSKALSDGRQSLTLELYLELARSLGAVAESIGRSL